MQAARPWGAPQTGCSEAVLGGGARRRCSARARPRSPPREIARGHVTESWTDSFFRIRNRKCGCPSGGGHVNFRKKQVVFDKSSIMGRPVVTSCRVRCRQGVAKSERGCKIARHFACSVQNCSPCRQRTRQLATTGRPMIELLSKSTCFFRKLTWPPPGRHPHF